MQIKFEILKEGDTVLNVWENRIAVKKENGDVEIYSFYLDEEGFPRLSEHTILVTHGDGSVSVKGEDTIEVTTF